MANINVPPPTPTQKPRKPFPAWRLPDGTINATETQLEMASESCEFWEWGFAGLVIVAVVAEFIIAGIHPSYNSLLEQWGTAIADAVIALGIAGEVLFGRKNGGIGNELRRRAIDRLAKSESSLQVVTLKLLIAEAKLEPRRLSPTGKKIIIDKIQGAIKHNVNFVIEQNDKANAFASSIIAALKEGGAPVGVIPYKMPPGEKLVCPVMLHCPGGNMSADDPLYQAMDAAGILFGTTSLTTLSLEMRTPTPSDIGKVFSPFPTGPWLPTDEYVVWVGEQSVFDDQSEFIRRFEEAAGPMRRT